MTDFEKIIDFAIEREKSAIGFYQELQANARFKAQVEVLKEFEMMEHGHVALLENVKKREGFKEKASVQANLNLSDYLVEHQPVADMSFQDILTIAIKKEERSMALYDRLADEVEFSDAHNIFERLASEEAGHKHHFEHLYETEISPDN